MCTGRDDPFFLLCCSEDGTVRRFDLRLPLTSRASSSIVAWPLQLRTGSVFSGQRGLREGLYSISLCPREGNHFVVAGGSPWVFLYDLRKTDREVLPIVPARREGEGEDRAKQDIIRRFSAPNPIQAYCRGGDAYQRDSGMTHISGRWCCTGRVVGCGLH